MALTGIEAGKAYVKFLLDDSELKKKLKGVGTQLKNIGKVGMTATAPLVAGFGAATAAALNFGDGLGDMAARTGIAVDQLSALQYAASQSDVEVATLERGIGRMVENIGAAIRGTGTFGKSLESLGLSIADLQGLAPDQQFRRIADAIARVEDPAVRASLAQQAFGKASRELMPLLMQGSEGMRGLAAEAAELGLVLTDQDVAALGELDGALKTAKQQVFGLAVQIGSAVAGPLTAFLQSMQPITAAVIGWIQQNPVLVATVAGVTTAVLALSTATYAVGAALTFLMAHPIILFLGGIAAAVWAIVEAYQAWAHWVTKVVDDAYGGIEYAPGSGPSGNSGRSAGGAMRFDAAAAQAQIDAAMANVPRAGAIAQTGPAVDAMSSELGRASDGIWKILDVVKAHYDYVRTQRNGGFLAGAN